MNNPSNRELHIILENLQDKIEVGFHGVHDRLNKINSSVEQNVKFRIQAKTTLSIFKWLFALFGVGIVGNVFLIIKMFI